MLRLHYLSCPKVVIRFFFNDTPTTEIYTLSLHDALPISSGSPCDIPHGTLIAGWPVTSKGHVLGRTSSARRMISSRGASSGGSGVAFIGVVGITSTSHSWSAAS